MIRRQKASPDYVVEICLETVAGLSKLEYLVISIDRRLSIDRDTRYSVPNEEGRLSLSLDRVFLSRCINEIQELENNLDFNLAVLNRFLPKHEFWSLRTEFSRNIAKALDDLETCNGSEGPAISDLHSHYLLEESRFPFGPIFDEQDVSLRMKPFKDALIAILDKRLT